MWSDKHQRLFWISLASLVAQTVKGLPAMQETWVRSLGQEDPLEKEKKNNNRIVLDKQASNKLGMELGFRGTQCQSPLLF